MFATGFDLRLVLARDDVYIRANLHVVSDGDQSTVQDSQTALSASSGSSC